VAPDVIEERHHRPGQEDPTLVLLRQGDGFGRLVRATTELAAVVGACDGDLPLGVIVGAVAQLLECPAGDVRATVVPAVRGLLADGLLTRPG
jgi:hypothetical protein